MTKTCKYCSKEYTTLRGITGCPECFNGFINNETVCKDCKKEMMPTGQWGGLNKDYCMCEFYATKVKTKPIATNKTSITKLNTIYELSNDKETIEAEVHNGKLTLSNHKGYEEFVFVGSDPARIRRMCELFIRACELVEETK